MNVVINQLITLVLAYGYPVIGICVYISAVGIPFPTVLIVLAAGSLAALGDLNIIVLFFLVTFCSVLGDVTDYWLGNIVGYRILEYNKNKTIFSLILYEKIQTYFFRWSAVTIYLTRWLFSLFDAVTNLIAGITGYPFKKFLLFDILGELTSSALFLGIGYLFSSQWQNIWITIQSFFILIPSVCLGLLCVYLGITWLKKR